ncbi:hypothetical protein Acr_23g0003490 [Actinidia rufa]|uniref:Uncharacterized protein n=1 Tax=Actinidia rufa TaxID=165716 RepID=A0A7J0GMR3_9ERIC|nr:hypothetical protein Acr_23g0003490 [Actinidia rufa]
MRNDKFEKLKTHIHLQSEESKAKLFLSFARFEIKSEKGGGQSLGWSQRVRDDNERGSVILFAEILQREREGGCIGQRAYRGTLGVLKMTVSGSLGFGAKSCNYGPGRKRKSTISFGACLTRSIGLFGSWSKVSGQRWK